MELRDYLPVLRRNLVVVLALVLVGILGGAAFGASRPASYTADAKVFVSARSATTVAEISEAAALITQAVASYADVATSALVLDPVIRQLGLDDSRASLRDRLTVTAGTDETVLDVQAKAATPEQAAQLANAVARQLPTAVRTLTSGSATGVAPLELRLVDPAVAPQAPDGPGLATFIAVGALIGLLLGFIAAVLRESVDSRLRSERQVALAAEAPVLGSIPRVGKGRARRPQGPRELLTGQAEAVRSVRNALQFLRVDGGVQSLVVTSAMPGDGKSSVSINLATSLADNGDRVLLVDGDLRKPDVARLLGLEGTIGLTDVLIGSVPLDDALQSVAGSSLTALPAGSTAPNPNELIQSAAMQQLMAQLLERFDRVVIDSPPMLPVSDAGVLAHLADGALIVVSSGRTSRAQLTSVVERLRRVDAQVLGAVLNSAPVVADESHYGVTDHQTPAPAAPAALTPAPASGTDAQPGAAAAADPQQARPVEAPAPEDEVVSHGIAVAAAPTPEQDVVVAEHAPAAPEDASVRDVANVPADEPDGGHVTDEDRRDQPEPAGNLRS